MSRAIGHLLTRGDHPSSDQQRAVDRSPNGRSEHRGAVPFEQRHAIHPDVSGWAFRAWFGGAKRLNLEWLVRHRARMPLNATRKMGFAISDVRGNQKNAPSVGRLRGLERTCDQTVLRAQQLGGPAHFVFRKQDRVRTQDLARMRWDKAIRWARSR